MYITLQSIKRNLGFNGLEVNDLMIGIPILVIFLIMFCLTSFKLFALFLLIIGIFLLIPINVSKKNRMYKVLFLVGKFMFTKKEYIFYSSKENSKKGMMFFEKYTKKD